MPICRTIGGSICMDLLASLGYLDRKLKQRKSEGQNRQARIGLLQEVYGNPDIGTTDCVMADQFSAKVATYSRA